MALSDTWAELSRRRRKRIKKLGKRLFERSNRFLASQSLVGDRPVFDSELFPWVAELEADWKTIRADLERVLELRSELPKIYEISKEQARVGADDNWKTFVLCGFGFQAEENSRACPETVRILKRVPHLETAFFSILDPGAEIPPHVGIPKGLLRCHLGLMVPDERERCRMVIDGTPRFWEEGRTFIFDDTYRHEVHNETSQKRVVLLFDFERPMKWRGRLLNRILLGLMRRTAVVQDARVAQLRWEERMRDQLRAVARA
jgi:beta-hydroxylase